MTSARVHGEKKKLAVLIIDFPKKERKKKA
jgi:hypothetical protein